MYIDLVYTNAIKTTLIKTAFSSVDEPIASSSLIDPVTDVDFEVEEVCNEPVAVVSNILTNFESVLNGEICLLLQGL